MFDNLFFDTSPLGESHSYQQAVFPFYPPKIMLKGETFSCKIYVENNQLRVCPFTDTGPTGHQQRVVLRALSELNFPLMHNDDVMSFFQNAVKTGKFQDVIDCTDLLIYSDKLKLNLESLFNKKKIDNSEQKLLYDSFTLTLPKNLMFYGNVNNKDESKPTTSEEDDIFNDNLPDTVNEVEIVNERDVNFYSNRNFEEEYFPYIFTASEIPIIRHVADRARKLSEGNLFLTYELKLSFT